MLSEINKQLNIDSADFLLTKGRLGECYDSQMWINQIFLKSTKVVEMLESIKALEIWLLLVFRVYIVTNQSSY